MTSSVACRFVEMAESPAAHAGRKRRQQEMRDDAYATTRGDLDDYDEDASSLGGSLLASPDENAALVAHREWLEGIKRQRMQHVEGRTVTGQWPASGVTDLVFPSVSSLSQGGTSSSSSVYTGSGAFLHSSQFGHGASVVLPPTFFSPPTGASDRFEAGMGTSISSGDVELVQLR